MTKRELKWLSWLELVPKSNWKGDSSSLIGFLVIYEVFWWFMGFYEISPIFMRFTRFFMRFTPFLWDFPDFYEIYPIFYEIYEFSIIFPIFSMLWVFMSFMDRVLWNLWVSYRPKKALHLNESQLFKRFKNKLERLSNFKIENLSASINFQINFKTLLNQMTWC